MSADLVRRLRVMAEFRNATKQDWSREMEEAADRIEELEMELESDFISHLRDNARANISEERVSELERELQDLREGMLRADRIIALGSKTINSLELQLAAEKALADQLDELNTRAIMGVGWSKTDALELAEAYRKARGL